MNRLVLAVLSITLTAYADSVTVYNSSDKNVYCAPYYTKCEVGNRQGPITCITPGSKAIIKRPAFRVDCSSRELLFSPERNLLKSRISRDEYRLVYQQSIANYLGDTFYLTLYKGRWESYTKAGWILLKPITHRVIRPVTACVAGLSRGIIQQGFERWPYKSRGAECRIANRTLCAEELAYRKERDPKTARALKQLTGMAIIPSKQPVIAVCASSGGIRSALGTLGALLGLEQAGILDCITYITTVSGSSWAVAPWMSLGMSLEEHADFMINNLQKGLLSKDMAPSKTTNELLHKFAFGKTLSLADIYGAALGSLLLEKEGVDPFNIYLSDQARTVSSGRYPYPIHTAVISKKTSRWYSSIEFSPHEIGSEELGAYVPTWAFGRKFARGASHNRSNPETLGFMMAIFGYAPGINLQEMGDLVISQIQTPWLKRLISDATFDTNLGTKRLLPVKVDNFCYKMAHLARGNQEHLTLVDGAVTGKGIAFEPLLERPGREIDLMIVIDNSGHILNKELPPGAALDSCRDYFTEKKIPFPDTRTECAANGTCTLFTRKDHKGPMILYIPMIKNEHYSADFDPRACNDTFCNTFNFTYTPEQSRLLIDLMRANVIDNTEHIVATIKDVITHTQKRK